MRKFEGNFIISLETSRSHEFKKRKIIQLHKSPPDFFFFIVAFFSNRFREEKSGRLSDRFEIDPHSMKLEASSLPPNHLSPPSFLFIKERKMHFLFISLFFLSCLSRERESEGGKRDKSVISASSIFRYGGNMRKWTLRRSSRTKCRDHFQHVTKIGLGRLHRTASSHLASAANKYVYRQTNRSRARGIFLISRRIASIRFEKKKKKKTPISIRKL